MADHYTLAFDSSSSAPHFQPQSLSSELLLTCLLFPLLPLVHSHQFLINSYLYIGLYKDYIWTPFWDSISAFIFAVISNELISYKGVEGEVDGKNLLWCVVGAPLGKRETWLYESKTTQQNSRRGVKTWAHLSVACQGLGLCLNKDSRWVRREGFHRVWLRRKTSSNLGRVKEKA